MRFILSFNWTTYYSYVWKHKAFSKGSFSTKLSQWKYKVFSKVSFTTFYSWTWEHNMKLTFWILPATSTSCVSRFSTEKTLYSNYTWIEPTQGRWRWRSHVRTECDDWFRLAETWSKDHTIGPTTLLVYLLLEFPFGINFLDSRYAFNTFLPNKLYKYL